MLLGTAGFGTKAAAPVHITLTLKNSAFVIFLSVMNHLKNFYGFLSIIYKYRIAFENIF